MQDAVVASKQEDLDRTCTGICFFGLGCLSLPLFSSFSPNMSRS